MFPLAARAKPILVTEPDTGACIGTDTNPPGVAITSPQTTSWPLDTVARAGAPMCCESGTTYSGAKGRRSTGLASVASLCSGGCTPWAKVFFEITLLGVLDRLTLTKAL